MSILFVLACMMDRSVSRNMEIELFRFSQGTNAIQHRKSVLYTLVNVTYLIFYITVYVSC